MKIEDKFYVSKRNRQGIYGLMCLALLIVFTPRLCDYLFSDELIVVKSKKIEQLKKAYKKNQFKVRSRDKKRNKYKIPPSAFDPNDYSLEQWMYLGLTEKQAAVVLRFSAFGIDSDEDLAKIVVIPSELMERIKDSTYYSHSAAPSKVIAVESIKKSTNLLVELNGASQEDLEKIPGIGSFFAKNILKFRDRLGGFVNKEQLLEVWKMDEEKYLAIVRYVTVQSNNLRKIKLNTVTAEELKSHPYLNWNIANSIIKIRERLKGFETIDEIKESILVNEELFNKLKPYLSL